MSYHHIYNRGAHRAMIFHDSSDYWRMLNLLYIANSTKSFNMAKSRRNNQFCITKKETVIEIVAYCLMPNHIHILIKSNTSSSISSNTSSNGDSNTDPSITKFMHKLSTAYVGYYNKKYKHSGTIWQGPYKEKIVDNQTDQVRTLIKYIHLNPYGLVKLEMPDESKSKETNDEEKTAFEYAKSYSYSSLKDYINNKSKKSRIQKTILSEEELQKWKYN